MIHRIALSRALYTAVAPLAVILLSRVPCAGIDADLTRRLSADLDLVIYTGKIGVAPYIIAAILVELAALIVPPWRHLREGKDGRVALARASLVLAVIVAGFQAVGTVRALEAIDPTLLTSHWSVATLTLVGGFCVLMGAAAMVSARGLFNGVLAVLLSGWLMGEVGGVEVLSSDHLLARASVVFCVVLATVAILARPRGASSPYPAPASGVIAAMTTWAYVDLPTLLSGLFGIGTVEPLAWWGDGLVGGALAVFCVWVFHRKTPSAPGFWFAAIAAVAYTLFLVELPHISSFGQSMPTVSAALLGGVLVDAWRHARLGPSYAPVEVYRRPFEADAARARMKTAAVQNLGSRTLLQFFGPFVPMTLFSEADAEPTRRALVDDGRSEEQRAPRWLVPLLACALAALAVFGADRAIHQAYDVPEEPPGSVAALAFMATDDESEWGAKIAMARDVPDGVEFLIENAPIGPGKSTPNYYARIQGTELRDEVKAWLNKELPADRVLRFGRVFEIDEETEVARHIGWRTYLLHDKVWLDNSHVEDAMAQVERSRFGETEAWFVTLQLTPEGGQVFEEVTGRLVNRRFAILNDEVVESAPSIREQVTGGVVRITMGAGNARQQRRDAENMAAAIVGRAPQRSAPKHTK